MNKKAILSVVLGLVTASGAFAQGTFNLVNGSPAVDAAISDSQGALIANPGYWVQAFTAAGPGAPANSLSPLGTPFRTEPGDPGYFYNGVTAIPGLAGGVTASVQIRAWSDDQNSYDAAVSAPGAQWGASNVVDVDLVSGTALNKELVGLTAFSLTLNPIPEPSVIMLGVVGAGLLWARRKK